MDGMPATSGAATDTPRDHRQTPGLAAGQELVSSGPSLRSSAPLPRPPPPLGPVLIRLVLPSASGSPEHTVLTEQQLALVSDMCVFTSFRTSNPEVRVSGSVQRGPLSVLLTEVALVQRLPTKP